MPGFTVRAALVCHPGPTVGYRLDGDARDAWRTCPITNRAACSRFADDPEWCSGLDLAAGVDVLIHDAQYTDEEYEARVGWGHSTFGHALAFARSRASAASCRSTTTPRTTTTCSTPSSATRPAVAARRSTSLPPTRATSSTSGPVQLVPDGLAIARGLLGAAQVGDGPTPEQLNVVRNLLHGYFGLEAGPVSLDPLSPTDLAALVSDTDRRRVVDLLVVVEFCRHPASGDQADLVEEYARALGVDEPFLIVARDALTAGTSDVMADWLRFQTTAPPEPGVTEADPELGRRLRALGDCPAGRLGRAYFDFYDRWQIPFPGEAGGGDIGLVADDFSHVLAGYEPDPPSELALQAMLTSATGFEHHFSGLVASLALFETGTFDILDITPRSARSTGPARRQSWPKRSGAARRVPATSPRSTISRGRRPDRHRPCRLRHPAVCRLTRVVPVAWAPGSASCRTPTCQPRCARSGTRSASRSRASI